MTDRLKGCWVAFDKDYREDDAQPILNAIRHIKCVAGVSPEITGPDDWIARCHVREELAKAFQDLLKNIFDRPISSAHR